MRGIWGMALVALALAAPAQAGSNGLIGKWVLAPGNDETCSVVSHIFTATTETSTIRAISWHPPQTSTSPVRYNTEDPRHIYVTGPGGETEAGRWEIIDGGHIRDTSFSDCIYQRG